MKILFLVFHGFSDISGISKKIFSQIDGLKASGHTVEVASYHVTPEGRRIRTVEGKIINDYGCGKLAALKKRMCYGALTRYILENRIEMVYIRSFHNANPFTIRMIKKLSKAGIKCVMEIPTYPYDPEYEGFPFLSRLELKVDQLFRKQLARWLDAIVTFSGQKEIFSKRTIRISNGIDFDKLPVKKHQNDTSAAIHLIGVAEVHYWHGFDRAIAGIGEYCRSPHSKEVFFHIIGGIAPSEMYDSTKSPGFHELIKKYGIENQIIFHGQKFGKELDDLFEKCDLAIGSLARHRCGIDRIKTLKNREYAARGIPFIYSETDEDFEGMPYILKIPADESPLDIGMAIGFYEHLCVTPDKIRDSITHLSWKKQMQKVIESL